MQTFLPYPSFEQSMKVLDYRRLGKQRVEAKHLIDIISGKKATSRYRNHPAVKMWSNNLNSLKLYLNYCIAEWVRRGYKNNMAFEQVGKVVNPNWLGNLAFHASHKSNLLRKDFDYYSKFGWDVPSDLPYIWPKSY